MDSNHIWNRSKMELSEPINFSYRCLLNCYAFHLDCFLDYYHKGWLV